MKNIIIDGKEFNISDYINLEDLVDTEFEGKDLSKIEVEDIGGIPDSLFYKTPVPCTLEEALKDTKGFDIIFDWVDYVQDNDNDEEATIAYIDNFMDWDRDHFEDSYEGYYKSEEDFAEKYLDNIGWDIDLSSYFDYSKYGEMLWDEDTLYSYTPASLEDYRIELGLSPLDNKSRKERELSYGFIGDDIEDEEISDIEIRDPKELARAQKEYDDFVEEHSFEIRLAELDNYEAIAEEYIDAYYGNIDRLVRDYGRYIRYYVDMERFASDLFDDYTFVDGYVFNN